MMDTDAVHAKDISSACVVVCDSVNQSINLYL